MYHPTQSEASPQIKLHKTHKNHRESSPSRKSSSGNPPSKAELERREERERERRHVPEMHPAPRRRSLAEHDLSSPLAQPQVSHKRTHWEREETSKQASAQQEEDGEGEHR